MSPAQEAMTRSKAFRIAIGALLLAVVAIGIWLFGGSEEWLNDFARRESQLRQLREDFPLLVFAAAFVLYVTITGLSLPGAAALSLVYGWYFGFLPGVLLVSFAATAGATVAFLLSRYLFRNAVQSRFGESLKTFNRNLERDGGYYLFTLRLIPAVPFFLINAVMGLTPMRTWTFWWVSQLGMLPGTLVYLYAGSNVPGLDELAKRGVGGIFDWQLILAFVLLAAFPLIVRQLVGLWRPPRNVADQATGGEQSFSESGASNSSSGSPSS